MRLLTHDNITADGELDPVRREALEAAARFYESLRLHDPDSERIRNGFVIAKIRQSEVLATLGELERALAITDEVLPLTGADPSAARLRFELRMSRGGIFDRLGDFAATAAEWQAARDEFGSVAEPDFKDRVRLGRSLHGTALVLTQSGDAESLEAAKRAMEWVRGLGRGLRRLGARSLLRRHGAAHLMPGSWVAHALTRAKLDC